MAGQFYDQLSLPTTYIVSPAAAQKAGANLGTNPVGAGPYIFKSASAQQINVVKNPTYWDASAINLAGIQFDNVTIGPDEVNTLEAGTVDASYLSSVQYVPAVKGRFQIDEGNNGNTPLQVYVCKSSTPFSNPQVRQALNYAVDRNQIVQTVLQGVGGPMWSLWPTGSAYSDPSLVNYYAYNQQKAKQLLSAAGYPNGFSASVQVSPALEQVFEVLQQEWAPLGVKITSVTSANSTTDFFVRHTTPLYIGTGTGQGTYGPAAQFVPGSLLDACNYNDPTITSLYNQAEGVSPSTPQGVALLRQVQQKVYQQALSIFVARTPLVVAYDSKVKNLVVNGYYSGATPALDYWTGLGIAK